MKSIFSLFFCIALMQSPLEASTIEGPNDFTEVAKVGIPAVVFVETKVVSTRQNSFGDFSNPFQGDDFFRHFFGVPQQQQQPPQVQKGQGSGFIISNDGYIVTNRHVVTDGAEITVKLNDGREFDAKLIGEDPTTDIALLKIEARSLPYLTLGDSDTLKVGQWIIAVGNPLGLQASLTVGVVSATGRNNLDITKIEDFIQTDAAINRGNSGGPSMNLDGEVIGMNTAIASSMGGNIGIGFAIPSNMIRHVVEQLQSDGAVSRGFMGVLLQPVDKNLAQAFDLESTDGALVADISSDSPAARAGIKQGDIITKYNHRKVTNIASLRNSILMMKPGTKVAFTVLRDGKTLKVPVEIGSSPYEENQSQLGIHVEATEVGLVIARVDSGSLAEWAGLRPGVAILEVNRQKITSVDDYRRALSATPKGKPVLFLIKHGDSSRYISIRAG